MNKTCHFFYTQITILFYFLCSYFCEVYALELRDTENKFDTVIKELHAMYKDAFENDKTYITRRIFSNNGHTRYTLNVQKLKEVNGLKTHNLRLVGRTRHQKPIIYINNPVEAQIPNAFLELDQFKKAMFNHVAREKEAFNINKNFLKNAINLSKIKYLAVPIHKAITRSTTAVPIKINKARFENFTNEIFNEVNKNIIQEVNVSNNTKLPKKTTISELITTTLQKRYHKISKKRKRKIHSSLATMPITTADDDKKTTERTTDKEISTETTSEEDAFTETAADEDSSTESSTEEEETTEATADGEMTTETTVDEQMSSDEEMTIERTTEPTPKTTRTKQSKPFVFMGGN